MCLHYNGDKVHLFYPLANKVQKIYFCNRTRDERKDLTQSFVRLKIPYTPMENSKTKVTTQTCYQKVIYVGLI